MPTWHFYDTATGFFVGQTFSGPSSALQANTPEGLASVPASLVSDWRTAMVDNTGTVVPCAPPSADNASAVRGCRAQRNGKLSASDWTQLPDAPLTEATKAEWQAYRQALRDVPQQPGFPLSVQWPEEPAP